MPDNVVPFSGAHESELSLTCACGCQSFNIFRDGSVACASCHESSRSDSTRWAGAIPTDAPISSEPPTRDEGITCITGLRMREMVIERITKEPPDFIISIYASGDIRASTFLDVETEEQAKWLRECMDRAYALLIADFTKESGET